MKYIIDEMKPEDWKQVAAIYLEGIEGGNATFETEVPSWEKWDNGHFQCCRLVARKDSNVLGWIALSPTSTRKCFSGVAEVSIYIGSAYTGQGIGKSLLTKLIEISENNGFWSLQSVIMKENITSINLHEGRGFRNLGIKEKIAQMDNGTWRDVVLMERRSKLIGID
ncbi:MAG: N-acetyltransferase family protein [Bacillota bacterium]|nr:N-acetyltransferase family protein [Bacillota bacterium]